MGIAMNRFRRPLLTAATALTCLSTLALPQAGHAGLATWINDTFTFREDQRERVAPQRNLPPKVVVTPNFDTQAQQEWSQWYSRDDLEAVPSLDHEATYVLRPTQQATRQQDFTDMAHEIQRDMHQLNPRQSERAAIEWQQQQIQTQQTGQPQGPQGAPLAHGWVYVMPTTPQGQMPQGWQLMQQRHQQNQIQQHLQQVAPTYIGAPHTVRPRPLPAGDTGVKTQISEPVRAWNEEPPQGFAARPGDFDYVTPQPRAAQAEPAPRLVPEGIEVSRTPQFPVQMQPATAQPSDALMQTDGTTLVTPERSRFYTVQPGDSLSGIAQQPQIYNEMELWPLIYDANRTQIADPDLIEPAQRLDIPRDHTANQRRNARQRAAEKRAPYRYDDGF